MGEGLIRVTLTKPLRSSIRKTGAVHNLGPVTTNPFFNFLRDCRKQAAGKSVLEIAKDGAKAWRKMSSDQKNQYKKMASNVYKQKGEHKGRRKRYRKRGSRESMSD